MKTTLKSTNLVAQFLPDVGAPADRFALAVIVNAALTAAGER